MLYMIIENFRNGDSAPVYARFREKGRLAPDGLRYVNSWVSTDRSRCYQVMECDDKALLETWMTAWEDLVEFEVHPAIAQPRRTAADHGRSDGKNRPSVIVP